MFASSSQRLNWMFSDESEIHKLKKEVNEAYVERHGQRIPVRIVVE